mgnify:CR=1 FL=1
MVPWADVLYACDWQWWNRYHTHTATFRGERWTCNDRAAEEFGLSHVEPIHGSEYQFREDAIHAGSNSGYQAIQLAAMFGATRIVLLGFDFQRTGGATHWHGDHPAGFANGGDYKAWSWQMEILAHDLIRRGVEVINCSRVSALECFKKEPLENILERSHAANVRNAKTIVA